MKVHVYNEQKALPLLISSVKPVVQTVLAQEHKKTDEVNVYFVSTVRICELHQAFFHDPSPTDCISFPIDEGNSSTDHHVLGEIFICPETALNYCQNGKGNVYTEVTLYLVHALLHLLGYDDLEPIEKQKMRAKEKEHLAHLKKLNLGIHK